MVKRPNLEPRLSKVPPTSSHQQTKTKTTGKEAPRHELLGALVRGTVPNQLQAPTRRCLRHYHNATSISSLFICNLSALSTHLQDTKSHEIPNETSTTVYPRMNCRTKLCCGVLQQGNATFKSSGHTCVGTCEPSNGRTELTSISSHCSAAHLHRARNAGYSKVQVCHFVDGGALSSQGSLQ